MRLAFFLFALEGDFSGDVVAVFSPQALFVA
jgi:hypothetical protein